MKWGALLALLLSAHIAIADEWPYVMVSCDPSANTVAVEERSASSSTGIPRAKGVQSLYDLTELKTINAPSGPQDVRVRTRDYRSSCQLSGITYKLVVSPWKFSSRINGMCGGYAPSTQLSVWRGSEKLIDGLVFAGYCHAPESTLGISAVRLVERAKVARFVLIDDQGSFEREVEYSHLPQLARGALARATR